MVLPLLNKLFPFVSGPTSGSRLSSGPRRLFARAAIPINLALQGGGAHGAFTWGVLDHLLSDPRITINAVSGTSAGAVNAVVLADGLARGGPEQAQRRLAEFWRAASFGGNLPQLQRRVVERLFSFAYPGSPANWLEKIPPLLSPYELNPLNINPLKDLIDRFVDFDSIRNGKRQLFVSATNVHTGEVRIFARQEITVEAVMASACLPLFFRAVEIDGQGYWDGGYTANPAIMPLVHSAPSRDLLIIQINPSRRAKVPATTSEIVARLHEITLNASLLSELRVLELSAASRLRLHRIALDDVGERSDVRGRLNTGYDHFELLRSRGQQAARRFLETHIRDLGRRSTIRAAPSEAEVA
jgi:NTE family protein